MQDSLKVIYDQISDVPFEGDNNQFAHEILKNINGELVDFELASTASAPVGNLLYNKITISVKPSNVNTGAWQSFSGNMLSPSGEGEIVVYEPRKLKWLNSRSSDGSKHSPEINTQYLLQELYVAASPTGSIAGIVTGVINIYWSIDEFNDVHFHTSELIDFFTPLLNLGYRPMKTYPRFTLDSKLLFVSNINADWYSSFNWTGAASIAYGSRFYHNYSATSVKYFPIGSICFDIPEESIATKLSLVQMNFYDDLAPEIGWRIDVNSNTVGVVNYLD